MRIGSLTQWLETVKEAKVEPPVDEDAGAGDAEPSIQSHQPVGLDRLDVDVHHPRELPLPARPLCVNPQSGSGIIDGLHKEEGEGAGTATRQDILPKTLFFCSHSSPP